MSTITIKNLEGEKTYPIVATLKPGRVIASIDGLLCFADYDPDAGWDLAQNPPSESDRAALKSLLTLDTTQLTVTPVGS